MSLKFKLVIFAFTFNLFFSNWAGAMELTEALRITKAWAETTESTHSLKSLKAERNGSFTVETGGAFFRYTPEEKSLLVSGLVADDLGEYFALHPKKASYFSRAIIREKSTLGEGQMEVLKTPLLRWKPEVVLLTKSFTEKSQDDRRVFTEIRWLMEWSTYWRIRRYTEVIESNDEDALIKEAVEIDAWVKKNRPRPW